MRSVVLFLFVLKDGSYLSIFSVGGSKLLGKSWRWRKEGESCSLVGTGARTSPGRHGGRAESVEDPSGRWICCVKRHLIQSACFCFLI
jgi:hypothetical protein